MSTPPLPQEIPDNRTSRIANRLHSAAIHLLRRARTVDRKTGLNPERLSLLSVLAFGGPQTVSQLAEIEMVSRPAVSRSLNSLEQLGLVRRQRSRRDRRHVVVQVTGKGRRLMDEARARRLERIGGWLSGLGDRELALLESAVEILQDLSNP